MNVFDLFAKISLDTSEYDNGLNESSKKTSSFASKIGGGLKTAAKVGVGAIAAIGTAATAMTGAIVKGSSEVAAYGDNIDKMSQKMGMSAQTYQEWDAIMQHSGTSIESMKSSMKILANAVESGNKAFERLGMTEEQIAKMNQEELFSATITALQNVEDTTERTYLAGQLLGRGATELGALLNTSAEETEAMRKRVHELGGVMSDEAVKAAAAFQDSLQDMQTAISGVKRNMQSEFLPGMVSIMNGLTEIFAGYTDKGLPLISEGVSKLIQNINKMIPKVVGTVKTIIKGIGKAVRDNLPDIMKSGLDILKSLISGIIDGIPELSQAAMNIVMMLSEYLIENLPSIINAAFELISYLADALVENLPVLIPSIVDIILQIVDTLTDPDNLMKLLDASISIIIALAEGLINAIPRLLDKAPVIVQNLVTAIIDATPKLINAAIQMLVVLVAGIADNLSTVIEAGMDIVLALIEGIIDWLSSLVKIGSKMGTSIQEGFSDFIDGAKQWGSDLIKNFIDGITEKWNALKEKVSGVAQTVKDYLGFSEPDKGPLSDFHTYAPDMMKLFASGIRDNAKLLTDAVRDTFDIQPVIQSNGIKNVEGVSAAGAGVGGIVGDIIIPVYIGDDPIQEVVIKADQINNYVSGGR